MVEFVDVRGVHVAAIRRLLKRGRRSIARTVNETECCGNRYRFSFFDDVIERP
jgi:hypothetical protein